MQYRVLESFHCDELGLHVPAGATVELTTEQARKYAGKLSRPRTNTMRRVPRVA